MSTWLMNRYHFLSKSIPALLSGEGDFSKIDEAAMFVVFAIDVQESVATTKFSIRQQICYSLRTKLQMLFRITAWSIVLIRFFEAPLWTVGVDNAGDMSLYPSFGIPFMSRKAAAGLTVVLLFVLGLGVAAESVFEYSPIKIIYLRIMMAALILKGFESFFSLILIAVGNSPISFSPIEIIFVLLVERRYHANIPYLVRIFPPFLGLVAALAAVVCTFTAFGYLIFDPGSQEMTQFFPTFGTAVWNMYMVLNGSNWPTPMMPAYDQNRLYAIFYVIFLVIVNWGFLNLTLGFIFSLFQIERQRIMHRKSKVKLENFERAFNILDAEKKGYLRVDEVEPLVENLFRNFDDSMVTAPTYEERIELISDMDTERVGKILLDQFATLEEKCSSGSLSKLRARTRFNRIFSVQSLNNSLAPLSNGLLRGLRLSTGSFTKSRPSDQEAYSPRLNDAFSANSSQPGDLASDSESALSHTIPVSGSLYSAPPVALDTGTKRTVSSPEPWQDIIDDREYGFLSEDKKKMTVTEILHLRAPRNFAEVIIYSARVVDSVLFDFVLDSLIAGLIALLIILPYYEVFYTIVALCLFESTTKLAVKGRYRYRRSYRNCSDGILTLLLLACCIGAGNHFERHPNYRFAIEALVILRFVLYLRNLVMIERVNQVFKNYRNAFEFAVTGAGDFLFLILMLFIGMYFFASIGQQLFGGSIRKFGHNSELIAASYFGESQYWPLNFNDMPSGMATMFVLLHVNNMHVTASGFQAVSSQVALIFFASWWCIGVLLMLNVVIAYLLTQLISYITQPKAKELSKSESTTINGPNSSNSSTINTELIRRPSSTLSPIQEVEAVEVENAKSPEQVASAPIESVAPRSNTLGLIRRLSGQLYSTPESVSSSANKSSPGQSVRAPPGQRFNKSIFASNTTRNKLSEWVENSYTDYRQSLSVRNTLSTRPSEVGNSQNFDDLQSAERNNPKPQQMCTPGSTPEKSNRSDSGIGSLMDAFVDSESKHIHSELHSSMLDWINGNIELEPHEAAAAMIQFARDGGQYSLFSTKLALKCFRLRQKFALSLRLASWLMMCLKIFERPYWTFLNDNWQDGSVYPMSGVKFLPVSVALAIKIPIMLFLLFGLALEFGYKENGVVRISYLSPKVVSRYILMVYCIAQCIWLLVVAGTGKGERSVVLASVGTCLYIFWFDKRAFQKLRFVLYIIPSLSAVLLALLVLVVVFAAFGPFMFNKCSTCDDDDFNQSQFETFADSVWSVFVAITSSSYPGQVMPLYRRSRLFFFYFFLFISIGAYGLLNLCIVVVLYQYNRAVQSYADHTRISREVVMLRAFQIMDKSGRGWLDYEQVLKLLNELYLHYTDFRKAGIPSESKRALLVQILDIDGDGQISPDDFAFLIDVTRVKLKLGEDETFLQSVFPGLAYSSIFVTVTNIVKSTSYLLIVDCLSVALMVADLEKTPDIYDPISVRQYMTLKIVILVILMLDCFLKYVFLGHREYFKHMRNKVDAFIAVSFFITIICFNVVASPSVLAGTAVYSQLIEILRVALFPRIFRKLLPRGSYALLNAAVKRIIRSVYTLFVVFSCAFFAMCNIGSFLYGGLISKSPTGAHYNALVTSQYGINEFWALNFNDMPSAFVTLFSCLHVSDFDVIASGFVAVTTPWARVYFTGWYVIGVVLLLNIVKSYFISDILMEAVTRAMSYKFPSRTQIIAWLLCRKVENNDIPQGSFVDYGNPMVPPNQSDLIAQKRKLDVSVDSASLRYQNYLAAESNPSKSQFVLYHMTFDSSWAISNTSRSLTSPLITSGTRHSMDGSARFKKYLASTLFVKDLVPDDRILLERRLLALEESTTAEMTASNSLRRSLSSVTSGTAH